MLYTLQNENVNINYLARLDFLDLCLLGETGTSKTRTAKLIHSLSPQKNAPFIAVNCAGLAGFLIESELSRYEKGAFTGRPVQSWASLKPPVAAYYSWMK